ncbi:outer membrane porin, OprD family [Sphingobacteriales bacterium UPWRP_1]|nr:hypothetical protein BVG80_13185 [Sphingobacteriales bacterium TSM_CSM]PSJ77782.1 outer membrane porin, OprD family [Sphingobacteriales bacterium UPWRP_1]
MYSYLRVVFILFLFPLMLPAQTGAGKETKPDTVGLHRFFSKGNFSAQARNDVMATFNNGTLTDYCAWAIGAGIGFESAVWKRFQFGVSGFFIYRLAGSNLTKPDSVTNAANRYEIGLFDMEHAGNYTDLDRLEELYLRYRSGKSAITLGKQMLNTPFINKQDGRMRPTLEEGIWLTLNEIPNLSIDAGWLYGISPRSTVKWYSVAQSVGIYPLGKDINGNPSGYKGNINTRGIGLFHVAANPGKSFQLNIWNTFAENMFNTLLLQTDWEVKLKKGIKWKSGLQYTWQTAVNHGGNDNQTLTYFPENNKANIISAKTGLEKNGWGLHAACTRITADGRFLFPREWGREPFFTFLQRERMEGMGNVHAATLTAQKDFTNGVKVNVAYGHFYTPDVLNVRLNKYGLPSFNQLNANLRYPLGGFFRGVYIDLLYVYKGRLGNIYNNPRYLINKADMHHLNLIVNYIFSSKEKK